MENEHINHIDKLINYVDNIDELLVTNYLSEVIEKIKEDLENIRVYYNAGMMWYLERTNNE